MENTGNGLRIGEINLSDHALQRANERICNFRDKSSALKEVRERLRESQCLGEVIDDKGEPGLMYAKDRLAFILSLDTKTVITIRKHESVTHYSIRDKVLQIHKTEMGKLRRREKSLGRQLEKTKLKLGIDLANISYKEYITKSKTVKLECQEKKYEIRNCIRQKENELKKTKDQIKQVAYSMVSVL